MNTDTTKNKIEFIFDTLGRAEVKITTFSSLSGISRATLHNWRNGEPVGDKLRLNLAYQTARRLREAKKQNLIPLRGAMRPQERVDKLRLIIQNIKMT